MGLLDPSASSDSSQRQGTPPLVGRDAELGSLRNDSGRVVYGGHGGAGIGKTRLVEELARRATAAMGRPALAARCYEGEAGFSYAPVLSWLRQAGLADEAAHATDGCESA